MHKSSEEFEIWPDPTTDCGVTMTYYIRAWMSSKFGLIRSGTTELAALEHLKKLMLPLFLVSQLWFYLGNSQVSVYRTICPLVHFVTVRLNI